MNVIISNERQTELATLDIEIIKSINGEFETDEIVQMFANFFFGRMVLDLTAIKNYRDFRNLQKLSMSLEVEKIIILLPDTPECLAPQFLSKLISMGIYNFTTNIDGVNYLLNNPNTYRDVAHLHQIEEVGSTAIGVPVIAGATVSGNVISSGPFVLGIKSLTDHAGATMLTYMLKQELEKNGKKVLAVEVDKRDFMFLNDKSLLSINKEALASEVLRHKDVSVMLVDLNLTGDVEVCNDVIYLVEPSTIKLNRLMRRDRDAFDKLKGKKIVLVKSLLSSKDVSEFEYEARTKVFYNLPPLDERADNSEVLSDFLIRLGISLY